MFMCGFDNFFLIKCHEKEVIDILRLRRARFTVHFHKRIIRENENTLRHPQLYMTKNTSKQQREN